VNVEPLGSICWLLAVPFALSRRVAARRDSFVQIGALADFSKWMGCAVRKGKLVRRPTPHCTQSEEERKIWRASGTGLKGLPGARYPLLTPGRGKADKGQGGATPVTSTSTKDHTLAAVTTAQFFLVTHHESPNPGSCSRVEIGLSISTSMR
jgi:hypothetical protein